MNAIVNPFGQEQAIMTNVPFELLDIIKNQEPAIQVKALAQTCKALYHWRCHYIAAHSTPASNYVKGLLENCSAKSMRESLSLFQGELPRATPIHLAYPPFVPHSLEKLDIVKTNFPNVQSASYRAEFRVDQNILQFLAATITFVTALVIVFTVQLASVSCRAVHRCSYIVVGILLIFERLSIVAWNLKRRLDRLDPLPLFSYVAIKVIDVTAKILARLGRRAKDGTLEAIASRFPGIKKLELSVQDRNSLFNIWGAPPMPLLPKLETLKVTGVSQECFDFSSYSSVTTVHLDGDDCTNEKMRLPPNTTSLTLLRPFYWFSIRSIAKFLEKYPQIQSLSLQGRVYDDNRVFPIACKSIEKLFIASFFDSNLVVHGSFPNLKRLSLSVYGYHLLSHMNLSPQTLEHLALKGNQAITEEEVAGIFTRFPSLKTLTYCLPQEIIVPDSHHHLQLQKLSDEEITSYFEKEHHLV